VQRGCHVGAGLPALADPPVRREDGAQPLRAVPRLLADGGQPGQVVGDLAVVPGRHNLFDVWEVFVQRRPADAGGRGHLRHADAQKSTAAHLLASRRQDGVA